MYAGHYAGCTMLYNLRRLGIFILDAFIVQTILFCVSFPILVSWGIMWSPLVFVGTLVMGPFLSAFLALSALIFVTELCFIPNGLLTWSLELCTRVWLACMSAVPLLPQIGYPTGPLAVMCLLPAGSLLLASLLGGQNRATVLAGLVIWTSSFLGLYGRYFMPLDQVIPVPIGRTQIECHVRQGRTVLVDAHGALQGRACSPSWVRYTLVPTLVKKTGRGAIDAISCPSPSDRVC